MYFIFLMSSVFLLSCSEDKYRNTFHVVLLLLLGISLCFMSWDDSFLCDDSFVVGWFFVVALIVCSKPRAGLWSVFVASITVKPLEHSAILLTFIKLPLKTNLWSFWEWLFYTAFTIFVWGWDRKICLSQSPFVISQHALWCQTAILGTDFFYPTITLMIDSYKLHHSWKKTAREYA